MIKNIVTCLFKFGSGSRLDCSEEYRFLVFQMLVPVSLERRLYHIDGEVSVFLGDAHRRLYS